MNNESAKTFPTVEIPLAHLTARLPNRLMASSTAMKRTNVNVLMLNSSVPAAQASSGKITSNRVEVNSDARTPHAIEAVIACVTPT